MESQSSKKSVPQLWYWNQPENGFSFEDAETIAKEFAVESKRCRSYGNYLLSSCLKK